MSGRACVCNLGARLQTRLHAEPRLDGRDIGLAWDRPGKARALNAWSISAGSPFAPASSHQVRTDMKAPSRNCRRNSRSAVDATCVIDRSLSSHHRTSPPPRHARHGPLSGSSRSHCKGSLDVKSAFGRRLGIFSADNSLPSYSFLIILNTQARF